jgi:transposase
MIQITPQMRILVALNPVDFRKGIDGLASICREKIKLNPFSGYVFVFRNRKSTAIKILVYDGQGYWLCQKRLSKGYFKWWPDGSRYEKIKQVEAHELALLIWNGNFKKIECAPMWKRLPSQNQLFFARHLRS